MTNSLQKILHLRYVHGYFPKANESAVIVDPEKETVHRFRKMNLLAKTVDDGIELYANIETDMASFLANFASETGVSYFDFEILVTDQNFYAYTEVMSDKSGISYLYESDASGACTLLDVEDTDRSNLFARVRIHFEHITENGHGFTIYFKARSIQWNYYFINSSSVELIDPRVVMKGGFTFEGPLAAALPNGQETMHFTSGNHLFEMSEAPRDGIQLLGRNNGPNNDFRVIFDGLPNPTPTHLRHTYVEGKIEMEGSVYIYI